ncbi:hypothetical protein Ccrd_024843 [Cynara cardunculus var. scolymus]|uniref:Uncharacterized protein n=1 Tax=Cynara cardunculus var. scolymus TaxID=59895 RepID=A0A103XBU8_CYNCS|nr:hypothetical protein Ccrd_024843 [Cynara cardunculus var. scolymus]
MAIGALDHAGMDRQMKPVYVREKSATSGGGGSDGQLSPTSSTRGGVSPMTMLRHSRSGSVVKRSQTTKAAAQRLAQMMTHQQTSDSEDDDDFLSDYNPPAAATSSSSSSATAAERSQIRPRSPMTVGTTTEQHSAPRAASIGRASQPVIKHAELRHQSMRSSSSSSYAMEHIHPQYDRSSSDQTPNSLLPSQSNNTAERVQPTSARSTRSPLVHPVEHPSSARAVPASRPNLGIKPVTMVPPSVPLTLRPTLFGSQVDTRSDTQKNKSSLLSRLSLDLGAAFAFRETSNQRSANASTSASASALQDEIDMLQEENESLLEKSDRCSGVFLRVLRIDHADAWTHGYYC